MGKPMGFQTIHPESRVNAWSSQNAASAHGAWRAEAAPSSRTLH
jgi:hypothetical protein